MAVPLVAETRAFRFTILFFNCLLTFGSYFCFDMPSQLQNQFTGNLTCTNVTNSTDTNSSDAKLCGDNCLGMTDSQYNLLYAIYAWTNAAVVVGAGVLIDKLGNRFGVVLFTSLCLFGCTAFSLGAMFPGTSYMLPIMLIGRLLFGAGNGSLTIVQNKITSMWFKDKELALAFGITLAFSRLGSVLNFIFTETFAETYGLKWTLWGGAILCSVGFLAGFVVSALDIYGVRQLGETENIKAMSKKVNFRDIRHFTLSYWLLCLTIMFFYNGVFPFVADAAKFIHVKYGEDRRVAGYMAGAIYDCSMILSPFLGGLIDVFGKRGYLALACALLTLPVYGLLAFTEVYPLVLTVWLGITYSFAAATTWPSIPLVVKQSVIGTAMGITTSVQMIGIGLSNLAVGGILGDDNTQSRDETLHNWKFVMIFLLCNALCCIGAVLTLNVVDKRQGGTLNMSKKERELQPLAINSSESNETDPLLRKGNR